MTLTDLAVYAARQAAQHARAAIITAGTWIAAQLERAASAIVETLFHHYWALPRTP